ncbi:MAG: hypothetical protein C5B51_06225 [Terriglobia bacterium]|nr:MAG: hypothetical protein C5B51_06225 [Terriglobia bacterium]
MRCNCCITQAILAVLIGGVLPSPAATFGKVVPIGGQASDIVLDESRRVLYIANFTANRIDVMSTADYTIRTSMNVAAQPGALAMSPDSQYLVVAHYGNFAAPQTSRNLLTVINLNGGTRQTFTTGDPPLAVAFTADGRALITTTTSLLLFDPGTGAMQVVNTYAYLGQTLPSPLGTFPTQVIGASMAATPDAKVIYGVAAGVSGAQGFFRFDAVSGFVTGLNIVTSPTSLPRISVAADGSWAMVGYSKWVVTLPGFDLAQFPNAAASTNIGGNVVDSDSNTIYAQILTNQPTTTTGSPTPPPAGAPSATPPVFSILDADNLTVREQLSLQENIVGRMVLNRAKDVIYAVSDSGVTVLPVGSMNQYHRLASSQSDVVARGNFCDQKVITQTFTITDPGGGNTDFSIFAGVAGVTISPSSGITPATVQIRVDPNAFQNQNGTVVVPLTIKSASAVNLPPQVRLLINNRNPDQRGTMIDIPGVLTDVLADPIRNRFYVVRQDMNQVLVFDSTSYQQIATLRTSTTPTQMAFTFDRKYLVVGHDNSQLAFVFDLDTLQPQLPIKFPPGHYPRSIAESGNAMLAASRNAAGGGGPGAIDRIDFLGRTASTLPSLGVFANNVNASTVLAPAPNGATILIAMPDGNVMLYDASADSFTVSRKDFSALQGAYAASSYNSYVVGNNVLNSSLVPVGALETASGSPSGFAFVDNWGFRTTVAAASSPGVVQRVDPMAVSGTRPTRMIEAPLPTTAAQPFVRSLAPLYDRSALVSLTISGVTVLPWNYDAAVAPPQISKVANAADFTAPVAPGGLISIFGSQMSPVNMATSEIPLPKALGESCLTVNGVPMPIIFVSASQINGQLPFNVDGSATMTLRTPGGISDNFYFGIQPAAPSIFRSGSAGPVTGLATVLRAVNNQLVTPSNPLHPGDEITIYATGLGRTSPPVDSGLPAPSDPLPAAIIVPSVTLGGVAMNISYAGLTPGEVGVYQINATVPPKAPQGMDIPLVVSQGGASTSLSLRVVN